VLRFRKNKYLATPAVVTLCTLCPHRDNCRPWQVLGIAEKRLVDCAQKTLSVESEGAIVRGGELGDQSLEGKTKRDNPKGQLCRRPPERPLTEWVDAELIGSERFMLFSVNVSRNGCYRVLLIYCGLLAIFGDSGSLRHDAPREPKRAISKILVNQRRNEPPCCHQLAHYLAFTKSAQEPERGFILSECGLERPYILR
jgi:hypothetical protein